MSKKKHLKGEKEIEQIREDLEDLVSYVENFNSFLPIAVCSISPNGDITEVNRTFEELAGYKPLEIIGRPLKTLFLEKDRIEKNIREATKGKPARDKELTLISKYKKKIPADLSLSLRKDKKGNPIGYFASIADITEIKKFQESLENQVQERTKELQDKIKELEKFQKITVGRELKMIELKKEMEKLKQELENQRLASPSR
jgi:PAS domain S-box-containing protein